MATTPTTFDPAEIAAAEFVTAVLSDGGRTITISDLGANRMFGTALAVTTGKHYFEMSYPSVVGATDLGIFPSIYVDGGGVVEVVYSQTDYASSGTIGVYFDADAHQVGYISPSGADTGLISFGYAAGSPIRVKAWCRYPPTDAQPPGGWVAAFNFGQSAFVHTLPPGYASGFLAEVASASATADLTTPPLKLMAGVIVVATATGDLATPRLTLVAQGHSSAGERAANIELPSLSVKAVAGANIKLALPGISARSTGTVTGLANAAVGIPSPKVAAYATVSTTGQAAITLPPINASSYAGALCSVTVGKVTTQATGTTGAIGRAQITLPLFEATASGTAQNHGSASITLPSLNMGATVRAPISLPGFQFVAIGTAVVTATYEAYAINLGHNDPAAHDEVTRYTNFPFTQIVRYQGSYFGVAADGLYLLEGTTDDGEAIPWVFKTAMTDFKSPFRKTVVSAYFCGRLGPEATIDLHVGEDGATTYNYATVRSDHVQCYRQKFGRGLTAHYYALGVSGTGTLELDNIEFDTMNSTRRI